MKLHSFQFVLAATATAFLAGCDVDVKDPGEAPTMDVDIHGDPGRAPDVDVTGPDIDVQQKEKTIDVPDVDVKTEEKTITVPDVNITVPDENDNEAGDNE
ncbi:MAG: hypothetical protein H0T47_02880 [Planctomycetaceae bacterium]|nr:hypothetical protein [Planctomycetaceae bacterium]